ncbi:MAG: hypothetical protein LUH05_10315, partial [Candidatus Gastranaerophilales bacterium]|nr:hypothetical protein [Candidatus Gastranaerophilales bacterium]
DVFHGYFTSIFQLFSYNVYPSLFGISLCHIFVFSLVSAYIIYKLKMSYNYEEGGKKYVYIMYGIFFIPSIMMLNSNPYKQTYSFWILLWIFTILLSAYKTKKDINSNVISISLAVLCSILISIRFECLILIIILPAMIYFLKIFDKKRFFVFLSAFLLLFSGLYCIEIKWGCKIYVLHNLLFVYDKLLNPSAHMINQLTDDDKLVIKKVYPEFETKTFSTVIDISDINNVKRVKNILEKHLILNGFNLFRYNLYSYHYNIFKQNNYIILCFFSYNKFYSEKFEKKFKFINLDLRNKILSNTMISTKYSSAQIYLKTIGNPCCYYLILFLILAVGIKYKKLFYIWVSLTLILIFSLLMVIAPWPGMLYVIPYYMCAYWMFIIFVLDTVQYLKNQNK